MRIYELIFGKPAPDSAVQGPPAYDVPLRRREFSAALPLLRAAIAQEDARAMGAYGALCATGSGSRRIYTKPTAGFFRAPIVVTFLLK